MRIFILDDEVNMYPREQLKHVLKGHDLTIATSKDEGVALYPTNAPYDLLLLDHDMEGNYEYRAEYPNTGMQWAKWLLEGYYVLMGKPKVRPSVVLHSHNPVGRKNMKALFEDHNWHVVEYPFGEKYVKFLKDNFGG